MQKFKMLNENVGQTKAELEMLKLKALVKIDL